MIFSNIVVIHNIKKIDEGERTVKYAAKGKESNAFWYFFFYLNFNRPEHDKAHDNEFYVMHDRIVHVNPINLIL